MQNRSPVNRRRASKNKSSASDSTPFIFWEAPVVAGHGTNGDEPSAASNSSTASTKDHQLITYASDGPPSSESSINGHPAPNLIEAWCKAIFDAGFGTLFELCVGKHGCPLV